MRSRSLSLSVCSSSTLLSLRPANSTQVWCVHGHTRARSDAGSNQNQTLPVHYLLLHIIEEYPISSKASQQIYIITGERLCERDEEIDLVRPPGTKGPMLFPIDPNQRGEGP